MTRVRDVGITRRFECLRQKTAQILRFVAKIYACRNDEAKKTQKSLEGSKIHCIFATSIHKQKIDIEKRRKNKNL